MVESVQFWVSTIGSLILGTILGWVGERFGKASDRVHRRLMLLVNAYAEIDVTVQFEPSAANVDIPGAIYRAHQGRPNSELDLVSREESRWAFKHDGVLHDLRRIGQAQWSYGFGNKVRIKDAMDFGANELRRLDGINDLPNIRSVSVSMVLPYRRVRLVIPDGSDFVVQRYEVTLRDQETGIEVDLGRASTVKTTARHFQDVRVAIQSVL